MSKGEKHNQVFRILAIILPLRKSCSVFPFKENFLLSEESLKLLLIQQKEFPSFPSASYFLLCFFPSVSHLGILLPCRSFLLFSERPKSSMSPSLLPVYLWPAPSVEWSLVCVWRCKLRLSSRARWNGLDHGRDPPLGTGLFGRQHGPSRRFLPPACSLSDWPCTVSSLIGGLARSISGVAHSASIFFAFHSLFLFRVIRDNKRELGFITWHLEE